MVKKKDFLNLFVLVTSIVVVVDQVLKFLVNKFTPDWNLGFLTIHVSKNTGAGFGILRGWSFVLGLISLLVAFLVIYYYKRIPRERIVQVLSALFLGGVIGNMIDRLFRSHVIDFIDFSFWPSFNIADACISIAIVGLVWWSWKKEE